MVLTGCGNVLTEFLDFVNKLSRLLEQQLQVMQ